MAPAGEIREAVSAVSSVITKLCNPSADKHNFITSLSLTREGLKEVSHDIVSVLLNDVGFIERSFAVSIEVCRPRSASTALLRSVRAPPF